MLITVVYLSNAFTCKSLPLTLHPKGHGVILQVSKVYHDQICSFSGLRRHGYHSIHSSDRGTRDCDTLVTYGLFYLVYF